MAAVVALPPPPDLARIARLLRSGLSDRIPIRRRSPDSRLSTPASVALRLGSAVLATLIVLSEANAQLEQPERAQLTRSLETASAAAEAGQFEDARRLYLQLRDHFPDAAEPRLGLANLSLALRETEAARRSFGEALQRARREDHRAQAELGLGLAMLALGDPEAAVKHFSAAESFGPVSVLASNGLGVAANMRGDHEAATAYFRRAQAFAPGNPRIEANLVRSLAAQGRIQEAAELYRSQPDTYWWRGDRDSLKRLFEDGSGSAPSSPEPDPTGEDLAGQTEPQEPDPSSADPSDRSEPAETQRLDVEAPGPSEANAVDEAPRSAVQIGSYRSLEGAMNAWVLLSGAHSILLGELDHQIHRVDMGPARPALYRLKAGPLVSREDAVQLCQRLTRLNVGCLPTEWESP